MNSGITENIFFFNSGVIACRNITCIFQHKMWMCLNKSKCLGAVQLKCKDQKIKMKKQNWYLKEIGKFSNHRKLKTVSQTTQKMCLL